MNDPLQSAVTQVRRGLRRRAALRGLAWGLLAGSLVGMGMAAGRAAGLWSTEVIHVLAVVAAAGLVGALIGSSRSQAETSAARRLDAQFGLKDRVLTAVQLAERPGDGDVAAALEALQRKDAGTHVGALQVARAVPGDIPRELAGAFFLVAAAVLLVLWPGTQSDAGAEITPPDPAVQAAGAEIQEFVNELEERLETLSRDDEEARAVRELVDQLREQSASLQSPETDVREALSRVSEMQQILAEQQAKLNTQLVEGALAQLGEAMEGAPDLEALSEALQQGDHQAAADALAELGEKGLSDPSQHSPSMQRSEKEASERMKSVAGEMKKNNLPEWSQATEAVTDSLLSRSQNQAKSAAEQMGELLDQHAQNSAMSKALAGMGKKLGEAKGGMNRASENASAKRGAGEIPGAGARTEQNSLAEALGKRRSDEATTNWGKSQSGNIDGAATELESQRQRDEISGLLGEGPSEKEAQEGQQHAERSRREFRDVHQEYEKVSEAVLESESIPLGQREHIRRYFRSIRPTRDQVEASDPPGEGGE